MEREQGLNAAQAEAVATLSGPLLVLAGAGTGKTRVVTLRIANLIRHGVAPDRILAVTFTNKAAGEMRDRVAVQLGGARRQRRRTATDPRMPQPMIGTFHSQCVRILRRHAQAIGFPAKFSIYDRGDQESLARSVLRELRLPGTALRPSDMLAIIGGWKNDSVSPEQAASLASTDREHFAAAAYRRYQIALRHRGAMDFDDLLLHTERLFAQHAAIRDEEAGRYDHVLVDEYQDTNGSQYRITKQLTQHHRNLCVVGDDDQSIYAWRGANVAHILNFTADWPDAKVIRLEENYRSTAEILKVANRLIAFNSERHEKHLRPSRPNGTPPRIEQHQDEQVEARAVVQQILKDLNRDQRQPGEIAILFRTNEQPRLFETELRRAKVPYVMLGAQSFFDRKEVRDLVAYLKWIEQPNDEIALLRIANTPARGLGSKTIASLLQHAVEQGVPLWTVMQDSAVTTGLPPAARAGIEALAALAADVDRQARAGELRGALQTLLQRTAYAEEVARLYEQPLEREARLASLEELTNAIGAYQDQAAQPNLTGFLGEIALTGRELGSEKDKLAARNAVWLLTMHAAKGLEFPVVYMVGLEEGLLPHARSVKSGSEHDIAEERRLCYVGITRAQERLTLSLALTRRKWGQPRPTIPSRFLYEIIGKAERHARQPHTARSRR